MLKTGARDVRGRFTAMGEGLVPPTPSVSALFENGFPRHLAHRF